MKNQTLEVEAVWFAQISLVEPGFDQLSMISRPYSRLFQMSLRGHVVKSLVITYSIGWWESNGCLFSIAALSSKKMMELQPTLCHFHSLAESWVALLGYSPCGGIKATGFCYCLHPNVYIWVSWLPWLTPVKVLFLLPGGHDLHVKTPGLMGKHTWHWA